MEKVKVKKDKLFSFLYHLLRDYLTPSGVEKLLAFKDHTVFLNPYLVDYAADLRSQLIEGVEKAEVDNNLENAFVKAAAEYISFISENRKVHGRLAYELIEPLNYVLERLNNQYKGLNLKVVKADEYTTPISLVSELNEKIKALESSKTLKLKGTGKIRISNKVIAAKIRKLMEENKDLKGAISKLGDEVYKFDIENKSLKMRNHDLSAEVQAFDTQLKNLLQPEEVKKIPTIEVMVYKPSGKLYTGTSYELKEEDRNISGYDLRRLIVNNESSMRCYNPVSSDFGERFIFTIEVKNPTKEMGFCQFSIMPKNLRAMEDEDD
jgi:hypothetical protein